MAEVRAEHGLTLEDRYEARYLEGPAALLSEKGTDGTALARFAFDATHQLVGPYHVADEKALECVLDALWAIAEREWVSKFSRPHATADDFFNALSGITLQGSHTHSGKYVQANSRTQVAVFPESHRVPYLSAHSAGEHLRAFSSGFGHKPTYCVAGRFFIACLQWEGKPCSVAQLLAQNHPTLRRVLGARGVSDASLDCASQAWAEFFQNRSVIYDHYLPQMLFPCPEGEYVALTAIPGISVYNALQVLHHQGQQDDTNYLPNASFKVGSSRPFNISTFASNRSGVLPLLRCEPPKVTWSPVDSLLRKAHGNPGAVLNTLSEQDIQKFSKDVHALPNARREQFFTYAARKHIALILADALTLRELAMDGQLADADLPVKPDALSRFMRGESLSYEAIVELQGHVVGAGPSGALKCHAESDVAFYFSKLIACLEEL